MSATTDSDSCGNDKMVEKRDENEKKGDEEEDTLFRKKEREYQADAGDG